jgi:hypothetical protein
MSDESIQCSAPKAFGGVQSAGRTSRTDRTGQIEEEEDEDEDEDEDLKTVH